MFSAGHRGMFSFEGTVLISRQATPAMNAGCGRPVRPQSYHRGVARRPFVGDRQQWAGCNLSFHLADRDDGDIKCQLKLVTLR